MIPPIDYPTSEQLESFITNPEDCALKNQVVITYQWYNVHRVVGHLRRVVTENGSEYFDIFGRVRGDKNDHQVTLAKDWAWKRIINISPTYYFTGRHLTIHLPDAAIDIVMAYHNADLDLTSTPPEQFHMPGSSGGDANEFVEWLDANQPKNRIENRSPQEREIG